MIMLIAYRRKRGIVASLAFVGTLCFVGLLPQSNELRYYMFIPLTWAAAIGMLFPNFRDKFPRTALLFLVVVVGLFFHMVVENSTYYQIAKVDYKDAAQAWNASHWWTELQRGQTYCAVGMMPIGILLTGPTMSEFSIVDRSSEALCPDGSTVVTDAGIHSRRVAGQP